MSEAQVGETRHKKSMVSISLQALKRDYQGLWNGEHMEIVCREFAFYLASIHSNCCVHGCLKDDNLLLSTDEEILHLDEDRMFDKATPVSDDWNTLNDVMSFRDFLDTLDVPAKTEKDRDGVAWIEDLKCVIKSSLAPVKIAGKNRRIRFNESMIPPMVRNTKPIDINMFWEAAEDLGKGQVIRSDNYVVDYTDVIVVISDIEQKREVPDMDVKLTDVEIVEDLMLRQWSRMTGKSLESTMFGSKYVFQPKDPSAEKDMDPTLRSIIELFVIGIEEMESVWRQLVTPGQINSTIWDETDMGKLFQDTKLIRSSHEVATLVGRWATGRGLRRTENGFSITDFLNKMKKERVTLKQTEETGRDRVLELGIFQARFVLFLLYFRKPKGMMTAYEIEQGWYIISEKYKSPFRSASCRCIDPSYDLFRDAIRSVESMCKGFMHILDTWRFMGGIAELSRAHRQIAVRYEKAPFFTRVFMTNMIIPHAEIPHQNSGQPNGSSVTYHKCSVIWVPGIAKNDMTLTDFVLRDILSEAGVISDKERAQMKEGAENMTRLWFFNIRLQILSPAFLFGVDEDIVMRYFGYFSSIFVTKHTTNARPKNMNFAKFATPVALLLLIDHAVLGIHVNVYRERTAVVLAWSYVTVLYRRLSKHYESMRDIGPLYKCMSAYMELCAKLLLEKWQFTTCPNIKEWMGVVLFRRIIDDIKRDRNDGNMTQELGMIVTELDEFIKEERPTQNVAMEKLNACANDIRVWFAHEDNINESGHPVELVDILEKSQCDEAETVESVNSAGECEYVDRYVTTDNDYWKLFSTGRVCVHTMLQRSVEWYKLVDSLSGDLIEPPVIADFVFPFPVKRVHVNSVPDIVLLNQGAE